MVKTCTLDMKFMCLDEHGLWWICRGLSSGEGGATDDGPGGQAEWPRVWQRWPQEGEEWCSGQTQSKKTHTKLGAKHMRHILVVLFTCYE